ncbi:hypothetical protein BDV41DRAFT_569617 [Aspergillus transmontanensis]|uniref:Uncharacterized protein n=1 Tax=Aspergillus transmontanensis TaxID=1034304 RepID=A0A5N6VE77_9EURO|nr:hypothetical protein BDV41DRAFT_569617 [Aspergillus transmontanensis]
MKNEAARPPLTLTFLFLLPGRSSQVRFPESQQCGLIEGRFVIDLQGGRRIYTGLSRLVFSQESWGRIALLSLVILQNFALCPGNYLLSRPAGEGNFTPPASSVRR